MAAIHGRLQEQQHAQPNDRREVADAYEPDDSAGTAKAATHTDGTAMHHTIHSMSDVDWVKFPVAGGDSVLATTSSLCASTDTVMGLFGASRALLAHARRSSCWAAIGDRKEVNSVLVCHPD